MKLKLNSELSTGTCCSMIFGWSRFVQYILSLKSTMAAASSTANSLAAPAWGNPATNTAPSSVITDEDVNNVLLEPYSTLDEPVFETIMRDVRAVGLKLKIVMLPLDRAYATPFGYMNVSAEEEETAPEELGENQKKVIDALKDWDLW